MAAGVATFLARLLLSLMVLHEASCQNSQTSPPPSPCPNVFRYEYDYNSGWYGVITIVPPARFSEAQLTVRLDLPYYRPDLGVGHVEIKGGNAQVQLISSKAARGERQKIEYLVVFPPINKFPRIAGVTINAKNFCPRQQTYSDTRGTIELKYSLKTGLNVPIAIGNDFSILPAQPSKPDTGEVIYVVQGGNGNTYVIPGNMLTNKPASIPVTRPTTELSTETTTGPPLVTTPSTTTLDLNEQYLHLFSNTEPTEETTTTQRSTTTRKARPTKRTTTSTTTSAPDYVDYAEPPPVEDVASQYQTDGLNCGVPSLSANLLVVRGEETEKGQWPWQAAMFKQSNTGLTFQCGGALISRRHIVTAAHCVYERAKKKVVDADTILIYLGKHNLRSWTEDGQQAKNVKSVIAHPKYGTNNHDFDVAILVLSEPATITDQVKPVCLWDKPTTLSAIVNKQGSVLGWGKDENGDMANTLKLARMPVVSQETCLRSDTFYSVFTSENTYCAGFRNGTSVCNGDSGGGMYFYLDNPKQQVKTWYTRGVVSVSRLEATEQTCDDRSYVVFTDLAKLLPWIRAKLRPPA